MIKRNTIINVFFIIFILILFFSSIFGIIWNIILKSNDVNKNINNEKTVKKIDINKKKLKENNINNENSFIEISKNIFSNTKILKNTIILDKINENINLYKESNFKFDFELFQKEIIKIISEKLFKFNLKLVFEYFNNFKIIKLTIINKDNINEKIIKNFKISLIK